MVPSALSFMAKKPGSSTAVEVGQRQAAAYTQAASMTNHLRAPAMKYTTTQKAFLSWRCCVL
jgi:hypothetical protein